MKKKWKVFSAALAFLAVFLLAGCPADVDDTGTSGSKTSLGYTLEPSNGTLHKADTTIVVFTFESSIPRDSLKLADLTIANGTGSIDAVSLSNSPGPTRMLTVSVKTEGNIKIKINKTGFNDDEKTVTVYKKLGFQNDSSVVIGDIVNIGGTPVKGANVTFGRYDGDPVAVLPPVTKDPITVVNASNPALSQVLATFSSPLDLTSNIATGKGFRWFDMAWEGFADKWVFANESTSGSITSNEWVLHNVQFYLDLINTSDERIRFNKTSETNTTTGEKKPVRFLLSDIMSGTGNTAWNDGHMIKEIRLIVHSVQLRDSTNKAWPTLSADRNANFDDMFIVSLTVDTILPAVPKVLYTADGGWDSSIVNPRWGYDDTVTNVATAGGIVFSNPQDGIQNSVWWDPIDITITGTPYDAIVVTTEPATFSWYGYGSICMKDGEINKNMNFAGAGSVRITLDSNVDYGITNYFDKEKFIGFFIQGNEEMKSLTITKIVLE